METKTENYQLTKPEVGSSGWGQSVNTNFDIIDEQMKKNAALVDTDKIADGSVTQAKLAIELLTYIQENGGANSEDVEFLMKLFEATSNLYNPANYDEVYNKYLNHQGNVATGLSGRLTGKIPVSEGKTYSLWLNPKEGLPNVPKWYDGSTYLHAYDESGALVSWGSGSKISKDSKRTLTFTVPIGAVSVACWVSDPGEAEGTSYFESMDEFRENIMLEEGEKTTFTEFGLTPAVMYTKSEVYNKDETDNAISSLCHIALSSLYHIAPNNLNKGEGTLTPSLFPYLESFSPTSVFFNESAVLNDTPIYPDEYEYMRRITSNRTDGNNWRAFAINIDNDNKPSIISYGFWVRDSDISNGEGSFEYWIYGGEVLSKIYVNLYDSTLVKGKTTIGTFSKDNIFSGSTKIKCLYKRDGFSYIAITWHDIVWDESLELSSFVFYELIMPASTPPLSVGKIDRVGVTFILENEIKYSIVYPDEDGKKQSPANISSIKSEVDYIVSDNSSVESPVIAYTNGDYVYIRSRFSKDYDSVITMGLNGVVGAKFIQEKLIPSSVRWENFSFGAFAIKNSGDDDYPINMNQGYIGGNHGLAWVYKLTKENHSFDFGDIGTVWNDSTTPTAKEFSIVSIIDSDNIVVVGKDTSTTDEWSLQQTIGGTTLTEIGGSSRTFTGWTSTGVYFSSNQALFPHVSTPKVKVLIDGKTLAEENKFYRCSHVDIINEYDIFHPGKMRQYAVDNVGTFTANVTQEEADREIARQSKHNTTFRCGGYGAMIIDYSIEFNMAAHIGYCGFIQASAFYSAPDVMAYAPRATANDLNSIDCRIRPFYGEFQDWNPVAADMIDPNKWTDRFVQMKLKEDSSLDYGWALGYNEDYAMGKQTSREINSTSVWSIYRTRKIYPRLMNNKHIPAGTVLHAISYRQPVHHDLWSDNATAVYFHEIAGYLYVYIDYHQSLIGSDNVLRDRVNLPTQYSGLSFDIADSTSNITLRTDEYIPSGGLILDVDCTVDYYAHLRLKVKL